MIVRSVHNLYFSLNQNISDHRLLLVSAQRGPSHISHRLLVVSVSAGTIAYLSSSPSRLSTGIGILIDPVRTDYNLKQKLFHSIRNIDFLGCYDRSREGRFETLSLSGSFTITDNGGGRRQTGGLSISSAGSDGCVVGGGIIGYLTAAGPIQDLQHENDNGYSDNHVVNEKCKLLSWIRTGEVVVEGIIISTNPQDKVHHMVLEPDFGELNYYNPHPKCLSL